MGRPDSCPLASGSPSALWSSSTKQATVEEEDMSAVLLAIFNEYKVAERVRVELVRDGFPTDRVELTAGCEPGRAGLEPADSPHGRFVQYFRVLLTFEDERHYAEQLAKCIDNGDATITVHPRGSMETARATQILGNAGPVLLISHDLTNQPPLRLMAKRARPWIIVALALFLLVSGYLVAKQGLGEVGFRVTPSKLRLEQPQETVRDRAELAHAGYSSSLYLSAVTARYFDTYLASEEFLLEAQRNRYTGADGDGNGWGARSRTAVGQDDLTDKVLPLEPGTRHDRLLSVHDSPMRWVARDLDRGPRELFCQR
jgi:hypothetical protein